MNPYSCGFAGSNIQSGMAALIRRVGDGGHPAGAADHPDKGSGVLEGGDRVGVGPLAQGADDGGARHQNLFAFAVLAAEAVGPSPITTTVPATSEMSSDEFKKIKPRPAESFFGATCQARGFRSLLQ